MAKSIEELDHAMTPLGELILRRRCIRSLDHAEIFEVKLDGEFLMSSLVNNAEIALSDIGLKNASLDGVAQAQVVDRDVLVGGLGLGYTAKAALDADHVRSVTVIELLEPVIRWHDDRLVPLSGDLLGDPRCKIVLGDFFELFKPNDSRPEDFGTQAYHAILLDIDHSPSCLLQSSNSAFYTERSMRLVVRRLHPGGVFAFWSADPPESNLIDCLKLVFSEVAIHECRFLNPLLNKEDVNWIVTAQKNQQS
ncbi:MAG: hypothetical protein DHS20C16_01870 [Phycisphaerae bacterium]|nr:MAG: hypothetical protein DHS20C16_01870 [Phycisphaerae bacterium]